MMMRRFITALVAATVLFTASCATQKDAYYTDRDPHVYGSRSESRNTGIVGGSIAGGIIGHNTKIGTAGGIVAGAVIGGILGDLAGRNNASSNSGMSTSSGNMGYQHY